MVIAIVFLSSTFSVKWRHRIPEIRFTAANAGMTGLNRPAGAVIELNAGTVVVAFRAFTSLIFKTAAIDIIIRAAAVDGLAICKIGSSQRIERRQGTFQQIISDSGDQIDRIWWTTCEVDDRSG